MKVKPRKKYCQLATNELRVINVNLDAVEELLFENMIEHMSDYFDVDNLKDEVICCMEWDRKSECLSYVLMPISYAFEGKQLDYDYIRKKAKLTTYSLFQPHRYRRLRVSPKCFVFPKNRSQYKC